MSFAHYAVAETDRPRGFDPDFNCTVTLCGSPVEISRDIHGWFTDLHNACVICEMLRNTVVANVGKQPESLLIMRNHFGMRLQHFPVPAIQFLAWHFLGKPQSGARFQLDAFDRWVLNDGPARTIRYVKAQEDAPRGCWNCCVLIPEGGMCRVCASVYSSKDVMRLNQYR